MKCVTCPNEIDHERTDLAADHLVPERRANADLLSQWKQVTVDLWEGRGTVVLFQGHLCPTCQKLPLTVAEVPTKKAKS